MKLGHLYGTTHELRAFVDKLILKSTMLLVLIGVGVSLDISLYLSVDNAAHFIGDRVSILDLTVHDSRRRIQRV